MPSYLIDIVGARPRTAAERCAGPDTVCRRNARRSVRHVLGRLGEGTLRRRFRQEHSVAVVVAQPALRNAAPHQPLLRAAHGGGAAARPRRRTTGSARPQLARLSADTSFLRPTCNQVRDCSVSSRAQPAPCALCRPRCACGTATSRGIGRRSSTCSTRPTLWCTCPQWSAWSTSCRHVTERVQVAGARH
jgi:hypothetical protein